MEPSIPEKEVQVKTISLSQMSEVLNESIDLGRRNYPLLFLASFAGTLFAIGLQDMGFFLSIISSIALKVWASGLIGVSQKVADLRRTAELKDFFYVFSNERMFKRTIPSFMAEFIAILTLVVMIIMFAVFFWKGIRDLDRSQIMTFGMVVGAVMVALLVPFKMFLFLLQLRTYPWKRCLRLALSGFFNNLLAFSIYGISLAHFALLGWFFQGDSSEGATTLLRGLAAVVDISATTIMPFFLLVPFLMYKKIYQFSEPDLVLIKSTTETASLAASPVAP